MQSGGPFLFLFLKDGFWWMVIETCFNEEINGGLVQLVLYSKWGVDCEVGLYSSDFELSNLAKYIMFVANKNGTRYLKTQSTSINTISHHEIPNYLKVHLIIQNILKGVLDLSSRSHASNASKKPLKAYVTVNTCMQVLTHYKVLVSL